MTADRSNEPGQEGVLRLLIAVPVAALRLAVQRLPSAVVGALLTLCGLLLLVSPLALWVAWSKMIFNTVLAVALAALCLAFALVMLGRDDQL